MNDEEVVRLLEGVGDEEFEAATRMLEVCERRKREQGRRLLRMPRLHTRECDGSARDDDRARGVPVAPGGVGT